MATWGTDMETIATAHPDLAAMNGEDIKSLLNGYATIHYRPQLKAGIPVLTPRMYVMDILKADDGSKTYALFFEQLAMFRRLRICS